MTLSSSRSGEPAIFHRGNRVQKKKGYSFPGIVVSVFQNLAGEWRYAIEADHPDFRGMLHIFNGDQLELRESEPVTLASRRSEEPAYENGNHWVRCVKPGLYEVYRSGSTHSTRCSVAHYSNDDAKAFSRVKEECDRREKEENKL